MSPADVTLAKELALVAVEIGKMIADLAGGNRPKPRRVRAVWRRIEQLLAKAETDAGEAKRWPEES